MELFWQKTQRRLQPEKNTVPAPRVPDMGGSSQKWRAARATTGSAGMAHTPPGTEASRRAPQDLGHWVQTMALSSF